MVLNCIHFVQFPDTHSEYFVLLSLGVLAFIILLLLVITKVYVTLTKKETSLEKVEQKEEYIFEAKKVNNISHNAIHTV